MTNLGIGMGNIQRSFLMLSERENVCPTKDSCDVQSCDGEGHSLCLFYLLSIRGGENEA